MMLASGKITLAGSGAAFAAITSAAARAMPWCSLVSVAVFTGAALIAALVPRWWLAVICAIVFVVLFGNVVQGGGNPFFGSSDFFDFAPTPEGETWSVSVNTAPQWLTVSDVMPMPDSFARWQWRPALTVALFLALFAAGVVAVYERKELK